MNKLDSHQITFTCSLLSIIFQLARGMWALAAWRCVRSSSSACFWKSPLYPQGVNFNAPLTHTQTFRDLLIFLYIYIFFLRSAWRGMKEVVSTGAFSAWAKHWERGRDAGVGRNVEAFPMFRFSNALLRHPLSIPAPYLHFSPSPFTLHLLDLKGWTVMGQQLLQTSEKTKLELLAACCSLAAVSSVCLRFVARFHTGKLWSFLDFEGVKSYSDGVSIGDQNSGSSTAWGTHLPNCLNLTFINPNIGLFDLFLQSVQLSQSRKDRLEFGKGAARTLCTALSFIRGDWNFQIGQTWAVWTPQTIQSAIQSHIWVVVFSRCWDSFLGYLIMFEPWNEPLNQF